MGMTSPLHQLNIQFRAKEGFNGVESQKLRENLATVLVGAAAEAGIAVVLDSGPLNTTLHTHDAETTGTCPMCLRLAQDGRS
jgi:hypothetical protein